MNPNPPFSKPISGYSLVEVVIAGFILVTAIAGAAILAHTLLVTEENNAYSTHALNVQEQAAKLYALGLSPTAITNILPEAFTNSTNVQPGHLYLAFATNSTNIPGLGILETATNTIVFPAARNMSNVVSRASNVVIVVRPSIR
jgi:hypothetical protein